MSKIVFFGTPDYVIPVVDELLKHFRTNANQHPIEAVVTQSPKPSGRDQRMLYSAVDEWAYNKKVPKFFDPNDVIKEQIDADLGVLASYGAIIPEEVIKHFRYGILNIHPSLLPKWRGASPIQASIISGDAKTGVSIIKLDEQLDHGLIVSQFKDEILDSDTSESLRKRLFERSGEVIPALIDAYLAGKITLKKQDEKVVTLARQIKKEDGFIPPQILDSAIKGKTDKDIKWNIPWMRINNEVFILENTPESVNNFVRAMYPWPVAWSNIKIKKQLMRIKIVKTHVSDSQLFIDEVQLEGKSIVSWKQFCEGYPNFKFC
jgi:methionyl-tRNA formyltransferase